MEMLLVTVTGSYGRSSGSHRMGSSEQRHEDTLITRNRTWTSVIYMDLGRGTSLQSCDRRPESTLVEGWPSLNPWHRGLRALGREDLVQMHVGSLHARLAWARGHLPCRVQSWEPVCANTYEDSVEWHAVAAQGRHQPRWLRACRSGPVASCAVKH